MRDKEPMDFSDDENDPLFQFVNNKKKRSADEAFEKQDSFDALVEALRADKDLYESAQNTIVPAYNRWFRINQSTKDLVKCMGLDGSSESDDRDFMDTARHDEKAIEVFAAQCAVSPARNLKEMAPHFNATMYMCKSLLYFLYHIQLGKQSVHAAADKITTMSHMMAAVTCDEVVKHFQGAWEFKALSDMDIKDDRMKLVVFLLYTFQKLGYRKKMDGEHVYSEVIHEGIRTRAYQPGLTIARAIDSVVRKESRADLYQASLKQSVMNDVIAHLRRCDQPEFPVLKVKDAMFSFLDGVYDCETDTFAYYKDVDEVFPELLQEYCTYKFFPQSFAPVYFREWRDIKNQGLEKIFEDQGWSEATKELKYATMGRTLWRAGSKDCWQCVTMDIGASGTGKSTCQHVWQSVFQFTDVMIFGANQEDRFGRDKLPDKRIFLAPDMRGDSFGISVEFFLVLAGNDAAVFPVKHGPPRCEPSITTPGMLATNELPPEYRNDVRGSVWRRLLPFPYPNEISPLDPQLKKRIVDTELPGIIRKAACAYLAYDRTKDIMTNPLPDEIEKERMKLQRASNSLVDFVLSEDFVRLKPGAAVERTTFIQAYGDFCKQVRRGRASSFQPDFYKGVFDKVGLSIVTYDEMPYVSGCELVRSPQDC